MSYFAMPYRVLFHDTMAYGTHHFLTNFKFQCEAREHLFFSRLDDSPQGKVAHENIILLTQQAYCRNLAPVKLGEKVAILLSVEEPTLSSVRFCFRVIRCDGVPVSCGFQTLVCLSRQTGVVVPAPPSFFQSDVDESLMERLRNPSFAERVLSGKRLEEIFDDEVATLAISIANAPLELSYPRIVSASSLKVSGVYKKGDDSISIGQGVIFIFPGQGSYFPGLLKELSDVDGEIYPLLKKTDEITVKYLGYPFLPFAADTSSSEYEKILQKCPDLNQIAIYLAGVLSAKFLIKNGLKPDLLIGHSMGELAALTIGGAYSIETGIELVCVRILSLQSLGENVGGMAAVSCSESRAAAMIEAMGINSLEIAVVNHPDQVVISGVLPDLKRLELLLTQIDIPHTRVQSRYPFHSKLLTPAVDRFASGIQKLSFHPTHTPVYSPIGRGIYSIDLKLPETLSSHLVTPFNFNEAINEIYKNGGRIFIECGGRDALTKIVRKNLKDKPDVVTHATMPAQRKVREGLIRILSSRSDKGISPTALEPSGESKPILTNLNELPKDIPIAIVSMGCVLPGAFNVNHYWKNIMKGISGISDAAEFEPTAASDFLIKDKVTPDKTYTLLGGFIRDFKPDISLLPYDTIEFSRLSSAQRFLTIAAQECLSNLKNPLPESKRIQCIIGSTADGSKEYDIAMLSVSLQQIINTLDETEENRRLFCKRIENLLGYSVRDAERFTPFQSISDVIRKMIGHDVKMALIDTACSSSLYSIDMGIKALRDFECNMALCGGVFAPGPANSCLFSQFRGLSAKGSRPFDVQADGVVFGEGAALLALKRLPDAIDAGDRIHAVIRGVGLSSDGKSPSVAEPKIEGQDTAIRRGYKKTGIPLATIQYIEAHATSTPVGDATEFLALSQAFKDRPKELPHIELGSVKALIGHTGWVAGAASIIKICKALEEKVIPPQYNFISPNPAINLKDSPFTISTSPKPWHPNISHFPRRAAVNGFGFGGTNAHLIIEEYEPIFHKRVCEELSQTKQPKPSELAIVGVGILSPSGVFDIPQETRFQKTAMRLPAKKMLLPDVTDHMDPSQFLSAMAVDNAIRNLPEGWVKLRDETGVVIGMAGKTGRGLSINQRVYLDFMRRLLKGHHVSSLSEIDFSRIKEKLFSIVGQITPSGPYTLPGLMPNVASGRVASLFDLSGPNMVIDADNTSLFEAISVAEKLLCNDDCKMVFAGGINGYAGTESAVVNSSHTKRPVGEAAMILAVTTIETAREYNLPILTLLSTHVSDVNGEIKFEAGGDDSPVNLIGAEGAIEIAKAIDHVQKEGVPGIICCNGSRIIRLSPEKMALAPSLPSDYIEAQQRLSLSPVTIYTPHLYSGEPGKFMPLSLQGRKLLILTDQPEWLQSSGISKALSEIDHRVVCPATKKYPDAILIDLSSEETIHKTIGTIGNIRYDTIIALKNLKGCSDMEAILADGVNGEGLYELLFAVARYAYQRLKNREVILAALCINAWDKNILNPYTGLLAGFVKSLARELPESICKVINTDEDNLSIAFHQIEIELAHGPLPTPIEICYQNSDRKIFKLIPLNEITKGNLSPLNSDSVVIATGGGRGVTAILVETLLEQFGCTVIMVGRTDLSSIPENILNMDEETFRLFETQYYREEMSRNPGNKIATLKDKYRYFEAVRELKGTLKRLKKLHGKVEYVVADITNEISVDSFIERVVKRFGRIDFILHGAGIQASKMLPKKTLEEFHKITATKLLGLFNLYNAAKRFVKGQKVCFHLLTSAFSYLGNDGQPDYGAANEAMNRIAEAMVSLGNEGGWATVAWLGWAGIGMTRGSEYFALAKSRGLHAITEEEGKAIFLNLLNGRSPSAVNILLTKGEISYYGAEIITPSDNLSNGRSLSKHRQKDSLIINWSLSADKDRYLADHLVNGVPTLPGTFEAELAAQIACAIEPDKKVIMMEKIAFLRFVKVFKRRETTLRGVAGILSESEEGTDVHVRLFSDFIHKSGTVLQKDILHFEATVKLTTQAKVLPNCHDGWKGASIQVSDPYLLSNSPVKLDGFFRCINRIEIGERCQYAHFKIQDTENLSNISHFITPVILIDGLCRFAAIHITPAGDMPICVPTSCGSLQIIPGLNDFTLDRLNADIMFTSALPRREGGFIYNDWAQASDSTGRMIVIVRNIVAQRFG